MPNVCFINLPALRSPDFIASTADGNAVNQRINLPIDKLESEILAALAGHQVLILQAPPGSGKTTRVPQFLLKERAGKTLILEPRRLAARLSAERVAEELGQSAGQDVGYLIRYEKVAGADTRCIFMTEGLFLRTLLSDPSLDNVDTVILDEFHERHLHSDIAFAMIRMLQSSVRPDLKLIIMSATLDTEKLSLKIPDAALLKAEVPTFPVDIEYDAGTDDRPLEWRVAVAVESLLQDKRCGGDILVFLTGAADIRRAAQALESSKLKSLFDTFELRAEIPAAEQRKVFEPHSRRKVILSTNVAETSVTINGVTGVVDSGLAKVASYAHWNGLPTLDVKPVSQSSCIQRAGRAGRTSSGVARRLFTRAEFNGRAAHDKPELMRTDLAQPMLEVLSAGRKVFAGQAPAFNDLPWLEVPPAESISAAQNLLRELGAVDADGTLTKTGESIVRWPLSPRLGRILFEGEKRGTLAECCLLVSLLNEGMLTKSTQSESDIHTDCDLTYQASLFDRLRHRPESISRSERAATDPAQLKRIEKSFDSLIHLTRAKKRELTVTHDAPADASPFARELMSGFPDRIVALRKGKSSQKSSTEAVFSRGGQGLLSKSSTVQESSFAIALQAEQIRRQGSTHFVTEITVAAGLNAQIIRETFSKQIKTENHAVWDDQAERVRTLARVVFEALVLEERQLQSTPADAEQMLFEQLKSRWPKPFDNAQPLEFFNHRIKLLRGRFPETPEVELSGGDFELFLVHICEGKKSFAEISENSLQHYIDTFIPWELKNILERELPARLVLGSGRKAEVHYAEGQPPWISSRMQDFFGTMTTPRLLQNSVPVTVHLLAPNGQAVQVTTDLAGFWKNVYPDVKKELSRRYPRHYWPDDPQNAEPPASRPRPNQTQAGTSRSK
ncbi:MAG: ATP-dependent helicase HrpB [Proteobacteria bacterium]|nr:ATP-dependent helicase HrpB [Pseudomonadota bacterium]